MNNKLLTWNTKVVDINTIRVHGKHVNFKDSSNIWTPINCNLENVTNGWEVNKTNFECTIPKYADDWAIFNNNNRFDIFTKLDINEPDFETRIRAKDALHIEGIPYGTDGIIYNNAYGNGIHLVYKVHHGRAPELQELIIIEEVAKGNNKYFTFELSYDGTPEWSPNILPNNITRMQARDNNRILLETPSPINHNNGFYVRQWNSSGKRGSGIKTPEIWDSGIDELQKREIVSMPLRRKNNGLYEITKTVTKSFQDTAVFPITTDAIFTIYPEPYIATTAGDWKARRSTIGEHWNFQRGGIGTIVQSSITTMDTQLNFSPAATDWYAQMARSIICFDVPVIENIQSAALKIMGQDILNELYDMHMTLQEATTANNTVGHITDYENNRDNTVEFVDNRLEYADFLLEAYNDMVLNSAGLTALGSGGSIFKLCLRNDADFDNSTARLGWGPVGPKRARLRSYASDQTGVDKDPYLELTTGIAGRISRYHNLNGLGGQGQMTYNPLN